MADLHSAESLKNVLEIFVEGKIADNSASENLIPRLVSLVSRFPEKSVLCFTACLLANSPNGDFSRLLQKSFSNFDAEDFESERKYAPVLQYLLNHAPNREIVASALKGGLPYPSNYPVYQGERGLLESAILMKHYGSGGSIVGALHDRITFMKLY